MALIKFELHHKHKDGTRQIRMSFLCDNGGRYRESTKEWVKEKNFKKGRLIASAKDATKINLQLDQMESDLWTTIREIRKTGQVTPDAIRAHRNKKDYGKKDFWEFFEGLIADPPPTWNPNTLKSYKKQIQLLRRFEGVFGKITFARINQKFADELTNFMQTQSYGVEKKSGRPLYYNDSTIANTFRRISGITTYAVKYKIIQSKEKISTNAKGIDGGAVYLNESEILKIYKRIQEPMLGDGIPDDLKIYGEIFVLGTQIGVRVSDLHISPKNIIEKNGKKRLDLSNQKTMKQVIIPLTKMALEILNKYNFEIPKLDETILNRNIKIICELAGINEMIISRAIERKKIVERTFYKFQKISSHTMRRSFATNMFKAGVPVALIMRITRHAHLKDFMRYIRIDEHEAADMMEKYF